MYIYVSTYKNPGNNFIFNTIQIEFIFHYIAETT